ncbi:MAG: hypothetical protein HY225_00955 [Candidatus Vogelbacteria bacterium]|nr:hypothetical protein [Candidatus Vogelbacteria bacterium]
MERFPDKPMLALGDILRVLESQKLPVGDGKDFVGDVGAPSYFFQIPEAGQQEKFVVYARREPKTQGLFVFFRTVWNNGLTAALYPYFGYIATQRNQGYGKDSLYYFRGLDAQLLFENMASMYVRQERS